MKEYKRQREEERQELAEMPKRLAELEAWVAERATAIETLPKVVSVHAQGRGIRGDTAAGPVLRCADKLRGQAARDADGADIGRRPR